MPSIRRLLPFLLACVLGLLLLGAPLRADEEAPADPPPPAAEEGDEVEEPAAETEAEPLPDAAAKPVLHKIYVPFRDLSKVFEKEGEGVFLPYEEFLELWQKAHGVEGVGERPPVPAAIRAASYAGEADGDMVTLSARLEVDVLAPGWQRIPLSFAGAGIEKAAVDGEPALLVPAGDAYELLLENEGRRTLDLRLRIPATRKGDRHTASFALPSVPLTRLTLSVPGSATEVDVSPRLASTTQSADGGRTELVAFLGPVGRLAITWRQKVDEGPKAEPLVFAEETHDVRVDRGVLRSELVADLSVLRAPLEAVALLVPSDAVTLYVQGAGIRTWERSEDGTQIVVSLREPVKESWQVRLGLERPLPALPATVSVPLAAVQGVERETGFVRLLMGEGVKVEASETPGLLQIDVAELPKALEGAPSGRAVAYRFPARPGETQIRVEALEPRLTASTLTRVQVKPDGVDVFLGSNLLVERAGIFDVAFQVPAGLEITSVRVAGAAYDDHKVREEDGQRVLAVELRDRLLGSAAVQIRGRMPAPLPEGEDDDQEVDVAMPLPVLRGADHVTGMLAVHLDSALEHRVIERTGLVVQDAGTQPPVPPGSSIDVPLAYAFEHHEGDIALTLALKRRAPAVTARVETHVRLEPDRTRIGTTLRYDVRYRGIDTMRFTAPLDLQDRLHLDMEAVELLGPERIEGEDADPERGIWTVKLPSPRTGVVPIALEVEDLPQEPLGSGASRPVTLPTFVPLQDDAEPLPNTVYDTAVRRDPLLEVAPDALESVEEIDARELPSGLRSDDNFLAFRAYNPEWSADVVVSHLHLDTVLARDGRATTEAYLIVRNNDRQNLELKLPPNATIRAVTVDGKSRSPRQGEEGSGTVLVPLLSGLGKDEAFVVALAYDHDVSRSDALVYETTRVESPVPLKVNADLLTWRVWAPADRSYTSFGGDVEPAAPYRSWFASLIRRMSQTLGRRAPSGAVDVAQLAKGFTSPFATRHEGRLFLFSNRVGVGDVELTSADPGGFAFWKLLFFVLFLVGVLFFARLAGQIGLGEGTFVAGVVLVLLVLLVRAGQGRAEILNAMLYGTLVAGAIRLFVHARFRWAERAAEAGESEAAEGNDAGGSDAGGDDAGGDGEPAPEGGAA